MAELTPCVRIIESQVTSVNNMIKFVQLLPRLKPRCLSYSSHVFSLFITNCKCAKSMSISNSLGPK
uniref:Uncharacterized protein n=1 Tax=Setaria italica TaxID=4555 RepID=K4A4F8_SETIT